MIIPSYVNLENNDDEHNANIRWNTCQNCLYLHILCHTELYSVFRIQT